MTPIYFLLVSLLSNNSKIIQEDISNYSSTVMFRGTPCITVVLEDQLAGNILTNEVNDQRCRNSCIVNIEVNSWSPLFLNLQINLTHIWHPGKCLKFNQSCRLQKPSNQDRKRNGWTLIGWKGTQWPVQESPKED